MAAYVRSKKLIARIEAEYSEPVQDVLRGFADLGYSLRFTAGVLEVSIDTMQRLAKRFGVEFRKYAQPPMSEDQKRKLSAIKLRSPRRDNRLITVDGETKHLSAWARDCGVHPSTIIKRIEDYGYTEAEAVRLPSRQASWPRELKD